MLRRLTLKHDDKLDAPTGSPDRKTRVDGDTVHHTASGSIYHGNENEPRRGLKAEQSEAQRSGWKQDEREVREAANGENQATPWREDERKTPPSQVGRSGTSDLTDPPHGKKNR